MDASALARAYLPDEPDHVGLRELLLGGAHCVVTSELARLELTAAVAAARRSERVRDVRGALAEVEADFASQRVLLMRLRPGVVFPIARRLLLEHPLRTLDALHLAVATEEAPAYADGEPVVIVTRDRAQAKAARALGLTVR